MWSKARRCPQMSADTCTTGFKLHANKLSCMQVSTDIFSLLATCMQPILASDRRWHADFPVPPLYYSTSLQYQHIPYRPIWIILPNLTHLTLPLSLHILVILQESLSIMLPKLTLRLDSQHKRRAWNMDTLDKLWAFVFLQTTTRRNLI